MCSIRESAKGPDQADSISYRKMPLVQLFQNAIIGKKKGEQ
jgi:hypothetical protein